MIADTVQGTFPPPPATAPHIDHVRWERQASRNFAQYLQGGVKRKVIERRYGKTVSQLAAIAERNGVKITGADRGGNKGRKAA